MAATTGAAGAGATTGAGAAGGNSLANFQAAMAEATNKMMEFQTVSAKLKSELDIAKSPVG